MRRRFFGALLVAGGLWLLPLLLMAGAELWYYVKTYDVSLRLPADWQVLDRHQGALLSVVSPPESVNDPFRENCALIASTLNNQLPVGLYAEGFRSHSRLHLDEYEEQESGETVLAGEAAVWWVYTHRQTFITAKVLAYVVVRANTAFVFSCSAQPLKFADYRPRFERMAHSLTFGRVRPAPAAAPATAPASEPPPMSLPDSP